MLEIGASYVDYIITLKENSGNKERFGEEEIELFIYILECRILCTVDGKEYLLEKDGYLFIPEGKIIF